MLKERQAGRQTTKQSGRLRGIQELRGSEVKPAQVILLKIYTSFYCLYFLICSHPQLAFDSQTVWQHNPVLLFQNATLWKRSDLCTCAFVEHLRTYVSSMFSGAVWVLYCCVWCAHMCACTTVCVYQCKRRRSDKPLAAADTVKTSWASKHMVGIVFMMALYHKNKSRICTLGEKSGSQFCICISLEQNTPRMSMFFLFYFSYLLSFGSCNQGKSVILVLTLRHCLVYSLLILQSKNILHVWHYHWSNMTEHLENASNTSNKPWGQSARESPVLLFHQLIYYF